MIRQTSQKGFTLIELMLSMAFIGALLVVIAMTSMQIMHTYTKGLTVREANQTGRTISDDIQRTVAASPVFKVEPIKTGAASEDEKADYIASRYVQKDGGGRLCTGNYTYAWNYGKTKEMSGDTGAPSVYNTYQDSDDLIRFIKVDDAGGTLCSDLNQKINKAQAKELLSGGDRSLAVQQFTITPGASSTASGQALYAVSMTLGTNEQGQLNVASATCLPPKEGSGNEDFCAINRFDIVVRAGNRTGSM